ncbi:MAG: hypothetical protein ACXAE3_17225 [Candidatus Kariarchaeaceae archaeon]|jgi:sporulation protein YlmC with PRC-barrel domain
MDFPEMRMNKLKGIPIEDNAGERLGRLIDAVFRIGSDTIELTKFVVGGSKIEEFLERIKVREDVDPIVPLEYISEFTEEKIILNVSGDQLK